MKRNHFSFRMSVVAVFLILITGGFTACKKNNSMPVPAAGIMIFNLAPDKDAVGVELSGSRVTNSPLAFAGFNGAYQNIYPGSRTIRSFDFLTDSTLAQSDFNFEDSQYYSMFLVGNNGVYKNIAVNDEVDSSFSSDHAYIRYINAIPDSSAPTVTIAANGSNIVNEAAPFTKVSSFAAIGGGDVNISVGNGDSFSANRTVTLVNGNIYTILLVGDPGATDSAKAVQIRYVLNGKASS